MDSLNWLLVLGPIGVLIIGIAGYYMSTTARYLTIREHETYNAFMIRELDKLQEAIQILEQTRPTTGELEARFYRIQSNGQKTIS